MTSAFSVKPDYSDYSASNWLVYRRTWLSLRTLRILPILVVVFFAINFVTYCFECGFQADALWWAFEEALPPAIFGMAGAMVFCAICVLLRSRKIFKQLGTVEQQVDFAFTESGFAADCETGSSNLEWKHLSDFLLDRRVLLLRRTPAMFYLIPVRQIAPEVLDETLALIRTGGVKQR